jgi:5-deoxy-glucuronate isomerase
MIRDNKCPLLIHPFPENPVYQNFTSREAGWEYLNFQAKTLSRGEEWNHHTGDSEMFIVLLGGNFSVSAGSERWETVNGRENVFSGLPHGLYLPPGSYFTLTAESEILDIACGWCTAEQHYPPHFITPDDVVRMEIEHRGGDNASRQINRILPPGSPCHRLVCVEVYTPSGNWSSFPAHKHDRRRVDAVSGKLLEAKLEEIYFYKVDKPQGFALQKVYNDDRSLDVIAEPHHNDVVLIPEGYHPVIAGHGYNIYYLNFLAGSDQSLASYDDPDHKWIYGTWKGMDPRIPLVTREMNDL